MVLLLRYSSQAKSERATPCNAPLFLKPVSVSLLGSKLLYGTLSDMTSHSAGYYASHFQDSDNCKGLNVTIKVVMNFKKNVKCH